MKTKILQEKLNECLLNIERVVGKDTTLPILNNILLKTEKNLLTLSATNLETGVVWKILSKNEKDGNIALPAQAFANFINSLPNKSIEITVDGFLATISCEGRKSVFKGLATDEFPALPINTENEPLIINSKVFCESLSQVVSFTSISSIKPEITGVYLVISKEFMKIVATDSFRLGEKTLNLSSTEKTIKDARAIILPQRAVREIVALFGAYNKDIKIYFTPNQITIELMMEEIQQPKIQFVTQLIEGEFPDYEAIIPTKSSLAAVFSKKEFINHIKSASLFASKTNEVELRISAKKGMIVIYGQSAELGEYEGEMKADSIEGEDTTISFNYKFLLDGLNVLDGDRCVLELSNNDGPGLIKADQKPDFIYIVMPIKKD